MSLATCFPFDLLGLVPPQGHRYGYAKCRHIRADEPIGGVSLEEQVESLMFGMAADIGDAGKPHRPPGLAVPDEEPYGRHHHTERPEWSPLRRCICFSRQPAAAIADGAGQHQEPPSGQHCAALVEHGV